MDSGWQTIETAPEGYAPVLLYEPRTATAPAEIYVGQRSSYRGWSIFGSDWEGSPTHWMPLPPPPEGHQG